MFFQKFTFGSGECVFEETIEEIIHYFSCNASLAGTELLLTYNSDDSFALSKLFLLGKPFCKYNCFVHSYSEPNVPCCTYCTKYLMYHCTMLYLCQGTECTMLCLLYFNLCISSAEMTVEGGFYNNGSAILECGKGSYSTGGVVGQCAPCPIMQYYDSTGKTGNFAKIWARKKFQQPFQFLGSSNLQYQLDGWTSRLAVKVKIWDGDASIGTVFTGATVCKDCDENYYTSSVGMEVCTECTSLSESNFCSDTGNP